MQKHYSKPFKKNISSKIVKEIEELMLKNNKLLDKEITFNQPIFLDYFKRFRNYFLTKIAIAVFLNFKMKHPSGFKELLPLGKNEIRTSCYSFWGGKSDIIRKLSINEKKIHLKNLAVIVIMFLLHE